MHSAATRHLDNYNSTNLINVIMFAICPDYRMYKTIQTAECFDSWLFLITFKFFSVARIYIHLPYAIWCLQLQSCECWFEHEPFRLG